MNPKLRIWLGYRGFVVGHNGLVEFALSSLWKLVEDQFRLGAASLHGPTHWHRVERNGLLLAQYTGADPAVIRMFALFHDSCRENEGSDPKHGQRGAELARSYRSSLGLSDEQFDQLVVACEGHTRSLHNSDETVGTCWDADRLDLARVGITPHPGYMSTEIGREIASAPSIEEALAALQKATE